MRGHHSLGHVQRSPRTPSGVLHSQAAPSGTQSSLGGPRTQPGRSAPGIPQDFFLGPRVALRSLIPAAISPTRRHHKSRRPNTHRRPPRPHGHSPWQKPSSRSWTGMTDRRKKAQVPHTALPRTLHASVSLAHRSNRHVWHLRASLLLDDDVTTVTQKTGVRNVHRM
jgi:hypothetical protein